MSKVIRRKQSANTTLVLRMAPGDSILIGNGVEIVLSQVETKSRLKMVVIAPPDTKIRRKNFEKTGDKVQGKGNSEA